MDLGSRRKEEVKLNKFAWSEIALQHSQREKTKKCVTKKGILLFLFFLDQRFLFLGPRIQEEIKLNKLPFATHKNEETRYEACLFLFFPGR